MLRLEPLSLFLLFLELADVEENLITLDYPQQAGSILNAYLSVHLMELDANVIVREVKLLSYTLSVPPR